MQRNENKRIIYLLKKEYLQELTFENIKVELPPEFIEIKVILEELYNKYVYELKNRKLLWETPSKSSILRLQRKLIFSISRGKKDFNTLLGVSACAQAIRISHAIGLLETQTISGLNRYLRDLFKKAAKNKGAARLVSHPNFNLAVLKSDELLQKNIEHPKVDKLVEIVKKEEAENEKVSKQRKHKNKAMEKKREKKRRRNTKDKEEENIQDKRK